MDSLPAQRLFPLERSRGPYIMTMDVKTSWHSPTVVWASTGTHWLVSPVGQVVSHRLDTPER